MLTRCAGRQRDGRPCGAWPIRGESCPPTRRHPRASVGRRARTWRPGQGRGCGSRPVPFIDGLAGSRSRCLNVGPVRDAQVGRLGGLRGERVAAQAAVNRTAADESACELAPARAGSVAGLVSASGGRDPVHARTTLRSTTLTDSPSSRAPHLGPVHRQRPVLEQRQAAA